MTCLCISKTTMVNKCETIYFIISISDKRLSSFFISLILSLFFYLYLLFPYRFHFNFVVSEWNVHIIFSRHIWVELSLLFLTFMSGTLSRWGGVCTCTPLHMHLGSTTVPEYTVQFPVGYSLNFRVGVCCWDP